jgi:uncharacterized protein YdeI (YjbR/CyaY-like superfamily)
VDGDLRLRHRRPGPQALNADGLPTLTFAGPAEWEEWLAENHDSAGVIIKIAKKGSGIASVGYPEVLDIALAYGWIDSVRRAFDDDYFLQKYGPRTKRSKWSVINRDKAEALIESGRMQPPGLAEVERAKADGRWDAAYEGSKTIQVPPDLQSELDARPAAAEFFAKLSSQNRYAILFRLHDAKKPETRARRLEKFVGMLERGETLH